MTVLAGLFLPCSIFEGTNVMSSADGPDLRPARQEAAADKKKAKAGAAAGDPLTEQLHELYDSVAREPIPESLLELLRKMQS
jgi:hypothetical protein